MTELVDTSPDTCVQPAEYRRLLGYPRDHAPSGRAAQLCEWAAEWYAAHGRPWVYARRASEFDVDGDSVWIDGDEFSSPRLQSLLGEARATSVALVAVSAGPEPEEEAEKLWRADKPDEYFFLEVYGSAVVEHLVTMAGARLCEWAESQDLAVLPHVSPGYSDWDIAEQPKLFDLMHRRGRHAFPGQLDVLDSGMLRPKKSMLAVFGLTSHVARVRHMSGLNPCESCSFLPCQYRRAPYRRATQSTMAAEIVQLRQDAPHVVAALDQHAKYAVNKKALARWAAERLVLTRHPDGGIGAVFRYEGTTCTNLGRRLLFDYHIRLGPRELGYPIRAQSCRPADGDGGYRSMCQYLESPESLLTAINSDTPLHGRPLNDVLAWASPTSAAGCYCEHGERLHKWRLVLETLHFALVEQEKNGSHHLTRQLATR